MVNVELQQNFVKQIFTSEHVYLEHVANLQIFSEVILFVMDQLLVNLFFRNFHLVMDVLVNVNQAIIMMIINWLVKIVPL